jgi:hypothetical protein
MTTCSPFLFVYCDRNKPYQARRGSGYCNSFVCYGGQWLVHGPRCERA